jgi:hypothetical protein
MKAALKFSFLFFILLVMGILMLAACSGKTSKNSAEQNEGDNPALAAPVEVRSMVGSWSPEEANQRGVWLFNADGTCVIRPTGLREQSGTYTFNGKELVLSMEHGTSRYEVLESAEPRLKLSFRRGNSREITVSLVRIQE